MLALVVSLLKPSRLLTQITLYLGYNNWYFTINSIKSNSECPDVSLITGNIDSEK